MRLKTPEQELDGSSMGGGFFFLTRVPSSKSKGFHWRKCTD